MVALCLSSLFWLTVCSGCFCLTLPLSWPALCLSWTQKGILMWNPIFPHPKSHNELELNICSPAENYQIHLCTLPLLRENSPHPFSKCLLLSLPPWRSPLVFSAAASKLPAGEKWVLWCCSSCSIVKIFITRLIFFPSPLQNALIEAVSVSNLACVVCD